jgi:hypothetical protein
MLSSARRPHWMGSTSRRFRCQAAYSPSVSTAARRILTSSTPRNVTAVNYAHRVSTGGKHVEPLAVRGKCPSHRPYHPSNLSRVCMKRVQNCSQQITDEDLEQLLPTLLLHLVDRCGGEVVFSSTDVQSIQSCLNEKMIQMLVGDDIRLRIITRPPELQP